MLDMLRKRGWHAAEQGFGLIGVLVVIIVIIALAGGGAYVWNRDHKAKPIAKSKTNSQSTSSTTTPNPAPDPYAGWKTYCDSQHSYCFKYPEDWTLESTSAQVSVLNSSKSTEVDYFNPYVHDGGMQTIDPTSITSLSVSGLDVKIVGAVYTTANQPYYGVVDASELSSYPLTVGQSASFPTPLSFTDAHAATSTKVNFSARATSQMSSESAAQAWFNTSDAKTSLQILQSLYYQK